MCVVAGQLRLIRARDGRRRPPFGEVSLREGPVGVNVVGRAGDCILRESSVC